MAGSCWIGMMAQTEVNLTSIRF